jgi:hypothetical protein
MFRLFYHAEIVDFYPFTRFLKCGLHPISSLASVGLISQRREGRTLFCVAEFEKLQSVIGFLQDECCVDECC